MSVTLTPGIDETRIPCSACGKSVWTVTMERDGLQVRVPVVVRLIVGQLPGTEALPDGTQDPQRAWRVDLNAVPVPQIIRDIMALPVARVNLCLPCFASVLGLELAEPTTPLPTPAAEVQG